MGDLLGVEEVLFFVDDVQDAKKWFSDLLGSEPYFDHANYCAFHAADTTVAVHPSDEKTSSGIAGQVIYWRVADIKKTIAHFESHGCSLFRGPIYGVDEVWVCQLLDPFGNVWGLLEK
ncbi:VOC family protein [Virgibacillus siamensis]|uniref:VOC family protein n=1 Tax=Virgibacillus siamensis TaxID=480071 RepID=UPI001FE9B9E0|nr:VOC family protein [Virgibacillus siamensis]